MNLANLFPRADRVDRNQPPMPRCFAAVGSCTDHIATDPSVRNTGGRESKASQVVHDLVRSFSLPRGFI